MREEKTISVVWNDGKIGGKEKFQWDPCPTLFLHLCTENNKTEEGASVFVFFWLKKTKKSNFIFF